MTDGPETLFGFVKRYARIAYGWLRSKIRSQPKKRPPVIISDCDGALVIEADSIEEALEAAEIYERSRGQRRIDA